MVKSGRMHLQQLNLGLKLKKLRVTQKKSLDDFALLLNLPPSLLLRMEKNEVAPPIATLVNIAKQAGVSLDYFLATQKKERLFSLTPRGKAKDFRREYPSGKNPLSYTFRQLAPHKQLKHMEPLLVSFSPSKEVVPQVAHEGEEFIYVLSGRLEFKIKNKTVELKAGDSLYFNSMDRHAFRTLGKKSAQALVVLYPD